MDQIINLSIPHIGEQIFESISTPNLLQIQAVSLTWSSLVTNVLDKRWKDYHTWKNRLVEASEKGLLDIVQMVVEHPETNESELNAKNWNMTAFEAACYYGQLEIVKLFLSYSSTKPIELDTRAQLAFKYACISGQSNKDVVKLLLDNFKSKINVQWPS